MRCVAGWNSGTLLNLQKVNVWRFYWLRQLFMRRGAGLRRGLLEVSVGRRREPDRRQSALSWPQGRGSKGQASQWEGDVHSPPSSPAWLSSAHPVITSSSWVGRRHGGQPGCCSEGGLRSSRLRARRWQHGGRRPKFGRMNGQSSPAFEDEKPSLHVAGNSISATKNSSSLLETSSTDMGLYSGQGAHHSSQDFFQQQQHQQPYSAQHLNPYAYHHYNLNGLGPGGAYSVGKAEYPYPHAGYREHSAFSREVQAALQDDGKSPQFLI